MTKQEIDLKTARLIRKLTQSQLGELIGVHPHTIADWEKDPGKVPMSQARKIVSVLKADFEIFLVDSSTICRDE